MAGSVRGDDARRFVKVFTGICNWNNGWDRWNDMVNLFAISLINPVDWNYRDQRNQTYSHIAAKYKPEEFSGFAELFGILVECLERQPFQDFLGDMYMQLDMGSKSHGQCFSPFGICQTMASMAMPEEHIREQLDKYGWISINDCACGAGATLIAAAERLHQMGINYQQQTLFIAHDVDVTVAMMCYIQLSMIGCAGRVRIGDTLTNPERGDLLIGEDSANTWRTPVFYSDIWFGRVMARRMDQAINRIAVEPIRESQKPAKPVMPHSDDKGEENGRGIQLSFID